MTGEDFRKADRVILGDENVSDPPLDIVLLLYPKSARMLIDAATDPSEFGDAPGYATPSDLPTHLREARLLAGFLAATAEDRAEALAKAYGLVLRQELSDEAYSQLDVPYQPRTETN